MSTDLPLYVNLISPDADIERVTLCPTNAAKPLTESARVALFIFNSVIESSIYKNINLPIFKLTLNN
jgi:hypothetical protein